MSQEKNLDLSRGKGTGKYNREVISLSSAIAVQRRFFFQTCQEFLSDNSAIQRVSARILQKSEPCTKEGHREEDMKFSSEPQSEPNDEHTRSDSGRCQPSEWWSGVGSWDQRGVASAGASLHPLLPQFLPCKTGKMTATLWSLSRSSSTRHRWKVLAEGKCGYFGMREVRHWAAERLICRHTASQRQLQE